MTAYIIFRVTAEHPEKLKAYQKVAPSIIKKYKGNILARGDEVGTLEGPDETLRIVSIEFPSIEDAKHFMPLKNIARL
ncbi:MAG: DUF1330 domain-containing protein [Pseudomonadota bacterium]